MVRAITGPGGGGGGGGKLHKCQLLWLMNVRSVLLLTPFCGSKGRTIVVVVWVPDYRLHYNRTDVDHTGTQTRVAPFYSPSCSIEDAKTWRGVPLSQWPINGFNT